MKRNYKKGEIVVGQVTGIKNYGIFVKLDNYHKGLIYITEINNSFIKNIESYVNIGELIRVRIIDNTNPQMLKLSLKKIDYRITNRHNSKIIETPNGFNNLALHLDYWIEREKMKKIWEILLTIGKLTGIFNFVNMFWAISSVG